MKVFLPLCLAGLGCLGLLSACAQGSTIGEGGAGGEGGTGSSSSKAVGATTGHSSTSVGVTSSVTSSNSASSASSTGSGQMCDFNAPNTCANAQGLPSVSGDNGGTATTTGVGSKWVTVRVTENNSSIFGQDLSYTATLTSPAGSVYDLYVHEGQDAGGPDCGAAPMKGAPPGPLQSVHSSWSDTQGLGGEDNSRWLNIEVRHLSGTDCMASWSLKIDGGT